MPDVLISYSRSNSDFVKQLEQALTQDGFDVWVDYHDIPVTADWWQEIQDGIINADNIIFVISSQSLASPICTLEVGFARHNNKRIIPLVYGEFDTEKDSEAAFAQLAARKLDDWIRDWLNGRNILVAAAENWEHLSAHNWITFAQDSFDTAYHKVPHALQLDILYIKDHTYFLERAKAWQSAKQDEDQLLRGKLLLRAEAWLESSISKVPAPTSLHREFIAGSRLEEDKRTQLWRRLILTRRGLLISALALASIVSLLAAQYIATQLQEANLKEAARGDTYTFAEGTIRIPNTDEFVVVEAFTLDKHEVSIEQYSQCVAAGRCIEPNFDTDDADILALGSNIPVVELSALQASDFCQWLGGRLPRASEWVRALQGDEHRAFPWGEDQPTPEYVNIFFPNQPLAIFPPRLVEVDAPEFASGTSPEGIIHLLGNAYEWTSTPNTCTNPMIVQKHGMVKLTFRHCIWLGYPMKVNSLQIQPSEFGNPLVQSLPNLTVVGAFVVPMYCDRHAL